MANLIPPQAQKKITKEYFLRVLCVWLYATSAGLLITALLLVPVFVLVSMQISAFSQQYELATDITADYKTAETELRDSATVARLLLESENYLPVSDYLNKLYVELSGDAIKLNHFSFASYEEVLAVSGVASNRERLANFKSVLEESGYFSRVELPISSLASETDISFSMNLYLQEIEVNN